MKKTIWTLVAVGLMSVLLTAGALVLTGCEKKEAVKTTGNGASAEATADSADTETKTTKLVLNEVAHSIFYAPMYVAIEEGYFQDNGIDLTLVNGSGADNVMTSLISGDADIGFMGSEASIYVYAEGMEDYFVNFAQLTQRAGNFLVSREANDSFTWDDIKGSTVLGGRAGGMPQMVFEYILKNNGIDPAADLTIDQSVSFGNTAAAFIGSDEYDYTVEFEPFATSLEAQGEGAIVASLGVDSGYVPYTSFCVQKSYMEENPDVIQAFTDALQQGMDYVQTHTPAEIADVIAPQFEETELEALTTIITRYYEQDTWKDNLILEEESFTLLEDILKEAGELSEMVPYEDLVNTEFAEKAADH